MIYQESVLKDIKMMVSQGYKPSEISVVCRIPVQDIKNALAFYEVVPPIKQHKERRIKPPIKHPTPSVVDDMQFHCHCALPDDPYDAAWDWAEDSYNNPDISHTGWRTVLRMY